MLLLGDFISGTIAFNTFIYDNNISLFLIQVIWIVIFYTSNLYNPQATLSRLEEVLRLLPLIYFTLVFTITLDIIQLINLSIDYRNIFVYGSIFTTGVIINRLIINSIQKILLMKNIGLHRAVIYGANRRGIDVYNTLKNHSHHGINIIGFVKSHGDPDNLKLNFPLPIIGNEELFVKEIDEHKIDDVIIALEKPTPEQLIKTIVNINGSNISIKVVPDMYEVVMGMARTNQLVGVPLIDINLNIETFYTKRLKRVFDIIISILTFFVILPIWIIIMLLIKIDTKGPVFYKQERCGKDGNYFNIIKFRSMIIDAEEETGPIWAGLKDKRITSIGKLLRRLHLDETPQILNIIKGDMSIVGPRPERPYFIEKLKKEYPFYQRRLKIRPGITGWAQIKQPFDTTLKDVHQKLKYDFFYIENISFILDIKIMINTIWVVFWGHPR